MGELRYLSGKGDSKVIWDPTNADEVEAAKAQFDILKGKGYKAFSVQKDGAKGKPMSKFRKTAGRIIMVPQIAGG